MAHHINQGIETHFRIIIDVGQLNYFHVQKCANIAFEVIGGFSVSQLRQYIGLSNRKTILHYDSDGTLSGFLSFQIISHRRFHKFAAIHFIATR